MIFGLILLILLLLVFFSISAAVIYHLFRYSPEKNQSILFIAVYIGVSFILLVFTIMAFSRVDWDNLM